MNKKYVVDIVRIGYSSNTYLIEAESLEEAENKAFEKAEAEADNFIEKSSEFEIGFIEEEDAYLKKPLN